MRTFLSVVAGLLLATTAFATAAGAQDAHVGQIAADPATVPEAGEYTLAATGTGWLPDTSILLTSCKAPGAALVPGTSSEDEIVAAALRIEALSHCDLATAVPINVDGDGNFTAELTAEVGDNFFFSAGALDGSQAGATWVPIVPAGAGGDDELAETGVETGLLGVVGLAVLAGGVMVAREARRHG